jgi:hypothetical protein
MACDAKGPDPSRCKRVGCCFGGGGPLPSGKPSPECYFAAEPFSDPIFDGCDVTVLGCYSDGDMVDPTDPAVKRRSAPYGMSCDICDDHLNQCNPKWAAPAPGPAPPCTGDKMDVDYCVKQGSG